jgi:hypothetical protein
VIACAGYRVTAKTGHHKISFDSIRLALMRDFDVIRVVTNPPTGDVPAKLNTSRPS